MGYFHDGACYQTAPLAAKSLCSSLAVIQSDGSFSRCTEVLSTFSGVDPAYGTLILVRTSVFGITSSSQQSFSVPACDYDTSVNPFSLSLAEGALIASAVLAVWGISACWRELAAFINQGGNSNEDLK